MPVMIFRVRLVLGVPGKLIAVNHLTFLDGSDFVITRPEVETDAAAIQMPAQGDIDLAGRRHGGRRGHHHGERFFVNARHQVHIKLPPPGGRITRADIFTNRCRTAHVYLPATAGPEQKFYDPFHVEEGVGIDFHANNGFVSREQAALPFQADDQWQRRTGGQGGGHILAIEEREWLEVRVQRGGNQGC